MTMQIFTIVAQTIIAILNFGLAYVSYRNKHTFNIIPALAIAVSAIIVIALNVDNLIVFFAQAIASLIMCALISTKEGKNEL